MGREFGGMGSERPLGTASIAVIRNHPIHPMLVSFPMAFLLGALLSDFGFFGTGDRFWARASAWLIGGGAVGGALAAIAGVTDFLANPAIRSLREARWPLLGNAAALILAVINLILRLGQNPSSSVPPWGLLLSFLVVAIFASTGWLSWELVYRYGVGVAPRDSLDQVPSTAEPATLDAPLSAALATIFRGKLCEAASRDRPVTIFEKGQVIYDAGEESRTLFLIQSGFVKISSITEDGQELLFDVRKGGDLVGELSACDRPRQDRAVALERSEIIIVPMDHVLDIVQRERDLLWLLVQGFCNSLADAYEQLSSLAFSDALERLIRALLRLGRQLGRRSEQGTEIPTYLTQQEIAQMVAVRRERVSTTMNLLRRRGLVDYSRGGYLVLNLPALENYGR